VNVFARASGYTVALTYGTESEWLRNVLTAGGCVLETGGRRMELIRPRVVHDPLRRAVPAPVRLILGLVNVSDFLELDLDSTDRELLSEAAARTRTDVTR
jgi:hypothetical protein